MLTLNATHNSTATPWLKDPEPQHETQQESKAVEWYQPDLKTLPKGTVELFKTYVGLKSEEEVKEHIYRVRDQAWNVLPYPCIGLFRFLDFSIHLSKEYPDVVQRLKQGESLLDLGCCMGQDLRKAAFDAGTSENMVGSDLEAGFLEAGFDLFRDRDTFQGKLIQGSIFAEDFLKPYWGKFDMIYLGSFLHLFNDEQQKTIIAQLDRLLKPKRGSMVFGRNLGADKGGDFRMEALGWDLYRHSQDTIKQLFEYSDGTWEVESSLTRYESANWDDDRRDWQGDETKQMMFSAKRL